MRFSQRAAAPDEGTKQKQSDGARQHVDVQRNEQPDFAKPERQHLCEAAGWINLVGLLYVTLDRPKAGKQSSRRPHLHREIQPKEHRRAACQEQPGTEQKRQNDQTRDRIFRENVAIPDQAQVDQSERQQDDQPTKQKKCTAWRLPKDARIEWQVPPRTAGRTEQTPSDRRPAARQSLRRGRAEVRAVRRAGIAGKSKRGIP